MNVNECKVLSSLLVASVMHFLCFDCVDRRNCKCCCFVLLCNVELSVNML